MRIIARRTLREFWEDGHGDARGPLLAWAAEVEAANWGSMMDIKACYASASVLSSERVIFNIAGNKYRLVCNLFFPAKSVYIKFIGTHAEYDKHNFKDD